MEGALVILAAMIVIGIILYLYDVLYYRKKHPEVMSKPEEKREESSENTIGKVENGAETSVSETPSSREISSRETKPNSLPGNPTEEPEVCCGAHTVCEKTNLSPITGEIVYYDDEELDRFRGRDADDYTPEEIEEFRDVLLTLLPADVAGWSRSIQVREIQLPTEVREELIMIVSELRQKS